MDQQVTLYLRTEKGLLSISSKCQLRIAEPLIGALLEAVHQRHLMHSRGVLDSTAFDIQTYCRYAVTYENYRAAR